MTNNVVYVCTDETDASCVECGKITESIGRSEWATVKCSGDNGINGCFVKVQAPTSMLQIAQIQVYTASKYYQKAFITSLFLLCFSSFCLFQHTMEVFNFHHFISFTNEIKFTKIGELNARKIVLENLVSLF